MKEDKQLRKILSKIISPENAENWWKPNLFVKNTLPILPRELKVIESPPAKDKQFTCFGFALGLQNSPEFQGEKSWNAKTIFTNLFHSGELKAINSPKKGGLILYQDNAGEFTHVGIMKDSKTVISKWSWGPTLEHPIWAVPTGYGDKITFFKNPKAN